MSAIPSISTAVTTTYPTAQTAPAKPPVKPAPAPVQVSSDADGDGDGDGGGIDVNA